jgi:prepilin signal peptidase PulO-like enzyme (type II secretory pathway)
MMKMRFWAGGDVKLLAGLGAAMGWYGGGLIIIGSVLAAGFFYFSYIIGNFVVGNIDIPKMLKKTYPFAPFITAAFLLLLIRGWV